MFKKIYKTLATVLTVISIMGLVWFCVSYAEVCCKNLTEAPVYSNWNLFQLLVNMGQETIPFFSVGSMRLPTLVRPNSLKVGNIWKWQILLKLENILFLKLPYMEKFLRRSPAAGATGFPDIYNSATFWLLSVGTILAQAHSQNLPLY